MTVLDPGSLPDLAAELAASGLSVSDLAEQDRHSKMMPASSVMAGLKAPVLIAFSAHLW